MAKHAVLRDQVVELKDLVVRVDETVHATLEKRLKKARAQEANAGYAYQPDKLPKPSIDRERVEEKLPGQHVDLPYQRISEERNKKHAEFVAKMEALEERKRAYLNRREEFENSWRRREEELKAKQEAKDRFQAIEERVRANRAARDEEAKARFQALEERMQIRKEARARDAFQKAGLAPRLTAQHTTGSTGGDGFGGAPGNDRTLTPDSLGHDGATDVEGGEAGRHPRAYAAVVVMACKRLDYLRRTVRSIESVIDGDVDVKEKFPLFISQDGLHLGVQNYVFDELKPNGWYYIQHLENRPPRTHTAQRWDLPAYYRISAHYKFALGKLFDELGYERIIVLEEDMELSPDFFGYFEKAGRLMDSDPSIYTVSSWNDNGQRMHVADERRLYRSDFFPGLGWMLHKRLWSELEPKWPDSFWDDWMRLKSTRKGRESIRPEVCRTFNFGEIGSSKGQFFKDYLQNIRMSTLNVDWTTEDLGYLEADVYEANVQKAVTEAIPVEYPKEVRMSDNVYKVEYRSFEDFRVKAKRFGIFAEWKDGVPRAGYRGVVTFKMYEGRATVMMVPGQGMDVAKTYREYVDEEHGGNMDAQYGGGNVDNPDRTHGTWEPGTRDDPYVRYVARARGSGSRRVLRQLL